MPHLVTIPIAILDITVEYSRPNMRLLVDRANVVDRLFQAFTEWKVKVDDVEVITEGKPSDQGIKFKIPAKRTSFMFGAGSCKLNRDDATWATAQETIAILNTGWNVLKELGEVEAGTYKTSIALHLQPKTTPFIDILKPFAARPLADLETAPIKAIAGVLKWDRRRVTIDGSSQFANGIFVRLEREFEGTVTYQQIAEQLHIDETQIFELLDVQEEMP